MVEPRVGVLVALGAMFLWAFVGLLRTLVHLLRATEEPLPLLWWRVALAYTGLLCMMVVALGLDLSSVETRVMIAVALAVGPAAGVLSQWSWYRLKRAWMMNNPDPLAPSRNHTEGIINSETGETASRFALRRAWLWTVIVGSMVLVLWALDVLPSSYVLAVAIGLTIVVAVAIVWFLASRTTVR